MPKEGKDKSCPDLSKDKKEKEKSCPDLTKDKDKEKDKCPDVSTMKTVCGKKKEEKPKNDESKTSVLEKGSPCRLVSATPTKDECAQLKKEASKKKDDDACKIKDPK